MTGATRGEHVLTFFPTSNSTNKKDVRGICDEFTSRRVRTDNVDDRSSEDTSSCGFHCGHAPLVCIILQFCSSCFSFAFVEFTSSDEVKSALDEHQGAELDGRPLFLDKMGGGRGGGGGGRGGRQSFGGRGGRQSFGDGGGDRRKSSSGGKFFLILRKGTNLQSNRVLCCLLTLWCSYKCSSKASRTKNKMCHLQKREKRRFSS